MQANEHAFFMSEQGADEYLVQYHGKFDGNILLIHNNNNRHKKIKKK